MTLQRFTKDCTSIEKEALKESLLAPLSDYVSVGSRPSETEDHHPSDLANLVIPSKVIPGTTPGPVMFRCGQQLLQHDKVDRHRPFCRLVCEVTSDYSNLSGSENFPMLVKDTKLIFPKPVAAVEYFRRAWRYFSENKVPTSRTPARSSELYGYFPQQEWQVWVTTTRFLKLTRDLQGLS